MSKPKPIFDGGGGTAINEPNLCAVCRYVYVYHGDLLCAACAKKEVQRQQYEADEAFHKERMEAAEKLNIDLDRLNSEFREKAVRAARVDRVDLWLTRACKAAALAVAVSWLWGKVRR